MSTPTTAAGTRDQDLAHALDFAADRFRDWDGRGALRPGQGEALAAYYAGRQKERAAAAATGRALPEDRFLARTPADESPPARAARYWGFVATEVGRHVEAGRLTLAQGHALRAEAQERRAHLRRRALDELPEVIPDEPDAGHPRPPARPLLETLLDPRSIQWLLALGGALMVVGVVILLWVNRYFTPPVIAVALGAGNAVLLASGWALIRKTRYQTAGRALTLLACLVMPLNLWYYHANGLITLGGHLWVAGLVITALYAASAWVLRDELFVYVLCAGVTLTGLLFLADWPPSPQRLWEIAAPSTMLVVLGLVAIHAERAFPDRDGPFGRRRFGLAFFRSGHALLGAGLLLLLGAHVAADWLYRPVFHYYYDLWHVERTPVVTETWGRFLVLGLVVAATYAYVYSDLVVRRVGIYVYLAAGTFLWAEVLGLEALQLHLGAEALIAVLAVSSLAANLAHALAPGDKRLTRAFPVVGLFLGLAAVAVGGAVYARAVGGDLKSVWAAAPPSWSYLGAMLTTVVACRAGAHLGRHGRQDLSAAYLFAAAAATLVGAVALLAALGLTAWRQHAPWLMLLPVAYLAAARAYRGRPFERPLVAVAHSATAVMLIAAAASAAEGFFVVQAAGTLHLVLALFFAEAAVFYGLAAAWRRQPAAVHLCAAMVCGTVWQLLTYAGVAAEVYTLTFAAVGLFLLVAYRLAWVERFAAGRPADAVFQSANTVLSLACLSAVFMGLDRLVVGTVHWPFVGLCAALSAASLLAVALVRETAWRRWYVVTALADGLLGLVAIEALSTLTIAQKLEVFSVAAGLALLAVGHVGWYRERERHDDLASICLFLGSLLAGLPLAVATVVDRWQDHFIVWNELGFLAVSVLLLATGYVFRLKSTTLAGGVLTALYFLLLLIYVPWSRLNAVAVIITTGGGLLFALGLVLSLYRDRLLTLPDRVKRREGVFRVLNWR